MKPITLIPIRVFGTHQTDQLNHGSLSKTPPVLLSNHQASSLDIPEASMTPSERGVDFGFSDKDETIEKPTINTATINTQQISLCEQFDLYKQPNNTNKLLICCHGGYVSRPEFGRQTGTLGKIPGLGGWIKIPEATELNFCGPHKKTIFFIV